MPRIEGCSSVEAKSRPQIVERIGMTRIKLDQILIKSDRLGISALYKVFITQGKKILDLVRVGPIRRRGGRAVILRGDGLIQGEIQYRHSSRLIGYLLLNAAFEQSPLEGVCELCSLA